MEDRRPAVVGVTALLQTLAWLAIAVRLGVRHMLIKRRLGWDDGEFDPFRTSAGLFGRQVDPLYSSHRHRYAFRYGARRATDLQ